MIFSDTLKKWRVSPGAQAAPVLDQVEALESLMLGRLAVLFVVLLIVVFQQVVRKDLVPAPTLVIGYALLALGFAFNLGHAAVVERIPRHWTVPIAQILFDTALTSTWVYFSGGKDSVYALLYLVQILVVALVFYQRLALFASVISSLGYAVVIASTAGMAPGVLLSWVIYTVLFLTLGFVGGFLSEELHRTAASLKQKENTIDRLQAFHERIIHDMPTGLLTVDQEQRINFINPAGAHILGRLATDVIGKPLADVERGVLPFFTQIESSPVSDDAEYVEPLPGLETAVSATGEVGHKSYFVRAKSLTGSARLQQTVEIGEGAARRALRGDVAGLEPDPGLGRLLGEEATQGWVLLFQDVTRLVHLEEKLKQHEKLAAVGQLAAGIAHEIRNPLASMSASIEMLKGTLPAKVVGDEEHRLMEIALREIDRLNRLISEFLDFVKPVKLSVEAVGLKELLSDIVLAARRRKDLDPKIEIRENYDAKVAGKGSAEKLKQVVWNLLVNAFQAMEKRGVIEIGCARVSDSRVKFWVEDEGPGLSEDARSHLFEPFFTTKDKGTGLGLATAYKIIEAHQGEIRVHSQPGVGTKFEVFLPIA